MKNLITDRSDWKLRLDVKDLEYPNGYKHFQFTGEEYNTEGELTSSKTYEFFLNKEEINQLSQVLWVEAS
jgi:hypothetical protein